MKESKIEKEVCKYAKEKGFLAKKFKSERGDPDRIFLGHGVTFFIEFKAPGEEPRAKQESMARLLRLAGFGAYAVDSIERGKAIIDAWEMAAKDKKATRQSTFSFLINFRYSSSTPTAEICKTFNDEKTVEFSSNEQVIERLKNARIQ